MVISRTEVNLDMPSPCTDVELSFFLSFMPRLRPATARNSGKQQQAAKQSASASNGNNSKQQSMFWLCGASRHITEFVLASDSFM